MKPRNYFNKAVESLNTFQHIPGQETLTRECKALQEFILTQAQCWHLEPQVLEMIWHTDLEPGLFEHMQLPMPVMAVEYDFDHELLGLSSPPGGRTECPPRCTIMMDTQMLGQAMMLDKDLDEKFIDDWPKGIVFYQFFRDPESTRIKEWGITPYITMIQYPRLVATVRQLEKKPGPIEFTAHFEGVVPSLNMRVMAERLGMTTMEMIEVSTRENPMTDDIRVCLGLLQLLQCRNVPVATIAPPAKLNAKRARKKHPLLPVYRTLRIASQGQARGRAGVGHGERKSPRAHMRRGFIRRQWYPSTQDHRNRWIQPVLVGSGEAVNTDVEVK